MSATYTKYTNKQQPAVLKTALTPAQKRQIRLMKELHSDRVDIKEQPEDIIRNSLGADGAGLEKVAQMFRVIEQFAPPRPVMKRKKRVAEESSSSSGSASDSEISVALSGSNDDIATKTLIKAIKATRESLSSGTSGSDSEEEDSDESSEGQFATLMLKTMPGAKRLRKSVDRLINADKPKTEVAVRKAPRVVPMPPPPPPPLPVEPLVPVAAQPPAAVVVVVPDAPCRMMAFNLTMLRLFAGNNPIKLSFLDRVMACVGDRVEATGIDVINFIKTDDEETAFYALVNAVVPMRFCGFSGVVVREFLSIEQAAAMRNICARLELPFDLYVTANYRLPVHDFEERAYRALGMGWDGALSFNHETRRARFWVIRSQAFQVGLRSWASHSLPRGSPDAMYADGATEFEYKYDAETQKVTLLGTPTIDDIVLERRGNHLYMTCGDAPGVMFVNKELRAMDFSLAAVANAAPAIQDAQTSVASASSETSVPEVL